MEGLTEIPAEELRFFDPAPALLPLYRALREALLCTCPKTEIRVAKTQISFCNRRMFAMVSLPRRRGKGWPKDDLLLSFGLPYKKASPRILQAVEPYPNRWTHHAPLEIAADADAELLGWLAEAYAFAAAK